MSAAPIAARPRYRVDAIPAELQALPRWVVFQIIHLPNGKAKKFPLIAGKPGRHPAASDNPRTWLPFDVALADAEARGLHLAFAFGRDLPFFFLDADNVFGSDGVIRSDIALLRDTLDTYAEWSISGTGLHIIGRGAFPTHSANRDVPPGCRLLERYPLNGGRFCIVTGNVLPGFETIHERATELAALFPPRVAAPANGSTEGPAYRGPAGPLMDAEITGITEWASPLWTDGRRHHMALYLSGYLGKQRVSRKQAAAIITQCAADDPDPGNALTACHDSFDALEAGEDTSGWHGLKDVCGLSDDQLAPLSAIFDSFWRRHYAVPGDTGSRSVRPLPPACGRRPIMELAPVEVSHAR
jgi:hypothetical protein